MRDHTNGRELIRPSVIRIATAYLTLRCLHEEKIGLRAMFGSEEWQKESKEAKTEGGQRAKKIIANDTEFGKML